MCGASDRRRAIAASKVLAFFFMLSISRLAVAQAPLTGGLIIKGHFIGGQPNGSTFGGGNLPDIFEAAARVWEAAIGDDFTVTFDYGWGSAGGGSQQLIAQGGTPNRETHGVLLFNNRVLGGGPDLLPLFLDPTPMTNSEFPDKTETSMDLGGGAINVERRWSAPGYDYDDLFTMVLHEIGHGLGLSLANNGLISEAGDGNVMISDPALSGTVVALTGSHLALPPGALMGANGIPFNSRLLPSDVDIAVVSQLSGFSSAFKVRPQTAALAP